MATDKRSIKFANCEINVDDMKIYETKKDCTEIHDMNKLFSELKGVTGLTVTIARGIEIEPEDVEEF